MNEATAELYEQVREMMKKQNVTIWTTTQPRSRRSSPGIPANLLEQKVIIIDYIGKLPCSPKPSL